MKLLFKFLIILFSFFTLSFGNLSNSSYSSNKDISLNANYNFNDKYTQNQKEEDQQKGISNVGYTASNDLSASSSKNLATLGTGKVTIKDIENSDDLERLNRDTEQLTKDLYDSSTGTKVDATLDTRLLTEEGRKQIAEDIERTKRLGEAVADVVTSDALDITDTFDHIGDVQKDLDVQKVLALKDNGKIIDILEHQENYSQVEIDNALNDYAQIYANTYGINIDDAKMIVYDKVGSTYTNGNSSNIYLDKDSNQNALDSANTLGHEVAHARQNQGETRLRETEELQEMYANIFGNYSADGLDFSAYNYNNTTLSENQKNALNSLKDLKTLHENSVAYQQDKNKANSGDGRIDDLTIFVHGTYSSPKDAEKAFLDALSKTYGEDVYQFDWSGKDGTSGGTYADNNAYARLNAGYRLSELIENYQFADGEPLNLIGHSHGGNVIKDFTQLYQGDKKIDNLVFLGTPVRDDYGIDYSKFENNAVIKNIYDTSDLVQRGGGTDFFRFDYNKPYTLINIEKGRIGKANQIIDNSKVENIGIDSGKGSLDSHSNLHTKDVWDRINESK